jgi:hypothetical protein
LLVDNLVNRLHYVYSCLEIIFLLVDNLTGKIVDALRGVPSIEKKWICRTRSTMIAKLLPQEMIDVCIERSPYAVS